MSYILVTGGAGFIGSHLTQKLLDEGHDVTVLDDLSGGFARNVPPKATFVRGSVADAKLVDDLVRLCKPQYVYHLAAYAAEGLSHFIRGFNYTNNVIGSVNIINACVKHQVRKLIFTSSIAVYGHAKTPFYESMTPTPADPYGIAKYAVEMDLAAAAAQFGLDYTIFRPQNVYGDRQHIGDKYRNVIGIFMNQLLQGKPLTVFGDGQQVRAFSHVSDIVGPMVEVLDMPETSKQVFNVGGDTPYTINRLVTALREVSGLKTEVTYLPPRKEAVEAYADHRKVRVLFKRASKVQLDEGLSRMWKWAQSIGPQPATPAPEIEVDLNMPPSWR